MRDKIIQLAWDLTTHKDTPEELLEMRSLAKLLETYCELNTVSHKGVLAMSCCVCRILDMHGH